MCYDLFLPVFFNIDPFMREIRTLPYTSPKRAHSSLATLGGEAWQPAHPCSVRFSRSRRPRVRRVVVRSTTSGLRQWARRVQEPGRAGPATR